MKYSAYYIQESEGNFSASIAELDLIKPEQGFVQIQVSHSSLNYKDALSATGVKGVTRNYPFVPGIDAVGVVSLLSPSLQLTGPEFRVQYQSDLMVSRQALGMGQLRAECACAIEVSAT